MDKDIEEAAEKLHNNVKISCEIIPLTDVIVNLWFEHRDHPGFELLFERKMKSLKYWTEKFYNDEKV